MAKTPTRELYVGVTDFNWFSFLSAQPQIDEVNFWRPGGGLLRAIIGAPFLFKLKSPFNCIAGVGFFEYAERMSISQAWEFYGVKNGAPDIKSLVDSIKRNRDNSVTEAHQIGCLILSQPSFFPREKWIEQPPEWSPSTQQGLYYNMDNGVGRNLWEKVEALLGSALPPLAASALAPFGGVAKPAIYLPRLGQGTFRRNVLAAYDNRCAITGERTIPVVEAAHIKTFAEERRHEINNGIALRSDIHKLFDLGFVSIQPDHRFAVSKRLAEDFSNGRVYYALDGQLIRLPADPQLHPRKEYLEEHFEMRFKR